MAMDMSTAIRPSKRIAAINPNAATGITWADHLAGDGGEPNRGGAEDQQDAEQRDPAHLIPYLGTEALQVEGFDDDEDRHHRKHRPVGRSGDIGKTQLGDRGQMNRVSESPSRAMFSRA